MVDINSLYPSKYLKSSDFTQPRQMTVARLAQEEVGQDKELKTILFLNESQQGIVLNKTNAKMMAHLFGSETDNWANQRIEIFSEPKTFGGNVVDGISIRPAPAPALPEQGTPATPVPAAPSDEIPY